MKHHQQNPREMTFGSDEWNEFYGLRHGSRPRTDSQKRVARQAAAAEKAEKAEARAARKSGAVLKWTDKEAAAEKAALEKILGPGGRTRAVKLIPREAPLDRAAVQDFLDNGWQVFPGGAAPGKVGRPLAGYIQSNPPDEQAWARILGPQGRARAIVVALDHPGIDRKVVDTWRWLGYDIGPAPARLQAATTPNPTPQGELDKATARARAWYGDEALITAPEQLQWDPPLAAVDIGNIVAIEYWSDKIDRKGRVYRHVFTRHHGLAMSVDGSTLILFPPAKITARGIEG
jgi:hypothetical protein